MSCSVKGCPRKYHSKGFCAKHAENYRRNGRIDTSTQDARPAIIDGDTALLPLGKDAKDGYAIVDAINAPLSKLKWHFDGRYPATRINDKKIRLHRLIRPRVEGMVVDHINCNELDNRHENLRYVTHAQNIKNQKRFKEFMRG